jgi:hypothetical protein
MGDEWIVRERIGLPVYDGDSVVDTIIKNPGDTVTREEFEAARQSEEDIANLVEFNTGEDVVEEAEAATAEAASDE